MLVIALSVKNHEYMYNPKTSHKVNPKKADKIVDLLNGINYMIKDPEKETWYIHNVDNYDLASEYAMYQSFTYGKTGLKRIH